MLISVYWVIYPKLGAAKLSTYELSHFIWRVVSAHRIEQILDGNKLSMVKNLVADCKEGVKAGLAAIMPTGELATVAA